MNIFILDNCPKTAAHMMCDKHIPKMIVESLQMMVIPFIEQGIKLESKTQKGNDYRISHLNHPCSKWARQTFHNFWWLLIHAEGLCEEYSRRFQKTHFCETAIKEFRFKRHCIKYNGFIQTDFVQAMPEQYRVDGDAVTAYRNYYLNEKKSFAKWQRGVAQPKWWNINE